jgi:hypothetical protein
LTSMMAKINKSHPILGIKTWKGIGVCKKKTTQKLLGEKWWKLTKKKVDLKARFGRDQQKTVRLTSSGLS